MVYLGVIEWILVKWMNGLVSDYLLCVCIEWMVFKWISYLVLWINNIEDNKMGFCYYEI